MPKLTLIPDRLLQNTLTPTLDFSDNLLSSVPSLLAHTKLTTLNLRQNKFKLLPPQLFLLPCLKSLDVSHNQVTYLPESVIHAQSLIHLHCSNNRISQLPESLGYLKLISLDLSHNQITTLPDTLGCIQNVQVLNLSHNYINLVPALFNNIKTLEILNLSNNRITDWTDLNDSQIKVLDLSHNRLVRVRLQLAVLIECDLGYNHITTVDLATPLIKRLELQNNQLVSVPESVLVLDRLNYLGLQSNRLNDLDNRLSVLTRLNEINFRGNPMSLVPLEIQANETARVKLYLQQRVNNINTYLEPVKQSFQEFNGHRITDGHLDLSKQLLLQLDPKLLTIGIIVLDLSYTKIPFPLQLQLMASLKTLKFNGNGLKELPEISLTITTLELCQNSLTKVFIDWPTLTSLNINYNQVSTFLVRSKLQTFSIKNNKLTQIRSLCKQESECLEHLDISNNQVKELPVAFVHYCRNLTTLVVSNNDLTCLPPLLGFLKQLTVLKYDGNMFKNQMDFMQWLRDKYERGKSDQIEKWALDREYDEVEPVIESQPTVIKERKESKKAVYESRGLFGIQTETKPVVRLEVLATAEEMFSQQSVYKVARKPRERDIQWVKAELENNFSLSRTKRQQLKVELQGLIKAQFQI